MAINLIAFLAMFIDKKKAKWGRRRIKENTLFLFVFLGGWIGAMAGMYTFRHKTKKPLFVIGIPLVAVLHVIAYFVFFY